ncbi:HIT domain-containing protein [Herbidospora sp. NEAU-GS84]|uniref:HIT domain-containing protein n=1 Tax=Herbidospora solisilvae TaxID=2696284 RepID=A0A7C9J2F5_9ACTN|nr:HIT domain-containing protein [Herbidospora solisilvae]
MSDCLFCAMIAGETETVAVYDDDVVFAFLDHRPVFKGHVLVVPKTHVVTLLDLDEVGPYFERVQALTRAVMTGLDAKGSFVALNNVVSQSVAHLHTHVVPRNPKDGLKGFFWPRTKYASDEEAREYAAKIRAQMS